MPLLESAVRLFPLCRCLGFSDLVKLPWCSQPLFCSPQAHVQTGITAAPPPHPGAPHPPQVMLLHPPQSHGGPPQGAVPQSGVPALSASTPSPYPYIGHPQGEQPGQAPGFPGGADDRIREFSLAGGIWHGRADGLQVGQDARVLGGE